MLAPLSWLRDYAPLDAEVAELARILSELGLVVEGVESVGVGLEPFVVAQVLAVRPHPNADRIRLVDVDAGNGENLQIVCGAWNFSAGDLVPFAPVGSVLPGGLEIGRRKVRGEWSNGMLCSASELELPDNDASTDGILLLPAGVAAPGTPLTDALGLAPDVVFDLDVSSNRPDALCMAGVARDLAAALGEPWSRPAGPSAPPVDASLGAAPITVTAGDLCPRFTGTIIEGAPVGPAPAWMANRLTLAGMRPISAIVDVSNYVMLDLGQPNHAYDLEQLAGEGILVRRGAAGETLETLDGVARRLGPDDCVICDAEGGAVGVGGIMGGARAEIAPGTTRVLLEAAWFSPMAIARTGSRLGLHSEARVRFERGVDPAVAPAAVDRFVALLAAVNGSAVRRGPTVDVRDEASLPSPPRLKIRTGRVNAVLGTQMEDADVGRLLPPIGFEVSQSSAGVNDVQVPSWRLDCDREIDVIEEIARMWGYGRIERTVPARLPAGNTGLTPRQKERRRVRALMGGAGFDEAWTTSFLAAGDLQRAGLHPAAVEVANPLDRWESLLRPALLPGLLKALRLNADRQAAHVALFEIGTVFSLPEAGRDVPVESEHLAAVVAPLSTPAALTLAVETAVRAWADLASGLRLSGWSVSPVAELVAGPVSGLHPGRALRLLGAGGGVIGLVGEVDPAVASEYGIPGRVGFLDVSLDAVADEPRLDWRAQEASRFPASDLDLAFLVRDDVTALAVRDTLAGAVESGLVEDVALFDVYRGQQVEEGTRSLAFRIRFRAPDRTLDEAELASLRRAAIDAVRSAHGATLRGDG